MLCTEQLSSLYIVYHKLGSSRQAQLHVNTTWMTVYNVTNSHLNIQ